MSSPHGQDPQAMLARCDDPGFTPGARDVAELLALGEGASSRETAKRVVKALGRGDRGVAQALLRGWSEASDEQRALRLRALGRIDARIGVPELGALLSTALHDRAPKVVREAARARSKLRAVDPSADEAVLVSIAQGAALPERRAAVEALGRIGGARALEHLRAMRCDDDDLGRRIAEATTLLARRADREQAGHVRLDRVLPAVVLTQLRCRSGAAATVLDQATACLASSSAQGLAIERMGDDAVQLRWSGSLGELYRVRSAVDVGLVFPLPPGATLVDRVVEGLGQPRLVAAMQAWTEGRPRFRLAFGSGGRHRAAMWQVAQRLVERASPLVNDSREVTWTVEVDAAAQRLLCLPRGADPRSSYRRTDVPAATHPTLAALLAWAGRPRAGEVVWDPFCGSGSELVEAAMLQPGLHLRGTDVQARAIAAARQNLAAADIAPASLELQQASALTVAPSHGATPVSLILSNPPMGRRVMVDEGSMRQLLGDFVTHAARLLPEGGRMVWLSPAPAFTARAGREVGLEAEDLEAIDMGGFFATPQILRKGRGR